MHVFGLTGGIASGKSSVAQVFIKRGVPVLDADQVARDVVLPGTPALAELVAHFGADILLPSGELHRKELGRRVFGSPDELAFLGSVTHPRIAARTAELLENFRSEGRELACYDAALMFEKNLDANFRPVVLVVAPERERVARLMKRDALTEQEALQRVQSQLGDDAKRARADFVIDNNGGLAELNSRAEAALKAVKNRLAPSSTRA